MESDHQRDAALRLSAFIKESFPRAQAGVLPDDLNLLESGVIDSMGLLIIIGFMEDDLGVTVDDSEVVMENFGTIRAMSGFVAAKREGTPA